VCPQVARGGEGTCIFTKSEKFGNYKVLLLLHVMLTAYIFVRLYSALFDDLIFA
jgi:hypothetical protein